MALGGRYARRADIEIIPLFAPMLIVSPYGPKHNTYGNVGEYLVIEDDYCFFITDEVLRRDYVCEEAASFENFTPDIRTLF